MKSKLSRLFLFGFAACAGTGVAAQPLSSTENEIQIDNVQGREPIDYGKAKAFPMPKANIPAEKKHAPVTPSDLAPGTQPGSVGTGETRSKSGK